MMWANAKPYLIVASAALNAAFIGMWIARAAPSHASPEETGQPAAQQTIWCPLHRELGVTEEQWAQIEPRLRQFQAAVGKLCQQTNAMRLEVIDLIAADAPDAEAIRAEQDEIVATKRQIQHLVVDHLLWEKKVLTPEQQRQLFEMLRKRSCCAAGPPLAGPPGGGPRPEPHPEPHNADGSQR